MSSSKKSILITGSNGFVGKNLTTFLNTNENLEILTYSRDNSDKELQDYIQKSDFIIHCAGTNRSPNTEDFTATNSHLTKKICSLSKNNKNLKKILFCSSTHVETQTNIYAQSKKAGEEHLLALAKETSIAVEIYRLPNIFGKWCKPNYNSFVSTMMHNIAHGLDIKIDSSQNTIELIYIDDICSTFQDSILKNTQSKEHYIKASPTYTKSLGEIYELLTKYNSQRDSTWLPDFKNIFEKKIYSTFLTYLPHEKISNSLTLHGDERGVFAEILKSTSGQVSFSTSKPGIVRGLHYHHTKCEKFIVLDGDATISQICLNTGKTFLDKVTGSKPKVVETIPGFSHKIENTGTTELKLLIWANEVFDPEMPDTFYSPF